MEVNYSVELGASIILNGVQQNMLLNWMDSLEIIFYLKVLNCDQEDTPLAFHGLEEKIK
jgi:hypothetical protein